MVRQGWDLDGHTFERDELLLERVQARARSGAALEAVMGGATYHLMP